MTKQVGYHWLIQHYGVHIIQPLRMHSKIGSSHQISIIDGFTCKTYPAAYQPEDNFAAHMTFALKYEGVFFEVLAKLFRQVPETEVISWMMSERSGQYARRTGFLWEWLIGRELQGVPPVPSGNYVDAIDEQYQLAASVKSNNPRWRVRDNMPGTQAFCPLVMFTDRIQTAIKFDYIAALEALNVEYGADILLRSAVWLTIKESRSSFQIEHETRQTDNIQRFAAAMEKRCGEEGGFLSHDKLADLQREIIGSRTTLTHFGLRQSPVFVGSTVHYENVVHYVAPHQSNVSDMLMGLEQFLLRTNKKASLIRAAVASFGFVYIHPLADGNGRIHRFLINDILRRDGAVPAPYILPISATIMYSPVDRARYDAILDVFSKPFMRYYGQRCMFGISHSYPDGIESDFDFDAYDDAAFVWQYPDFTAHVEYMADILERTIKQEMTNEALWLRNWDNARSAIKKVLDGPNSDIDKIIRSLQQNQWQISNVLKKQFPLLNDACLAEEIINAVRDVFG